MKLNLQILSYTFFIGNGIKALKGKGNRSVIRIIYAFYPEKFVVEFLEIYFKEKDDSDMNYDFVKKYFDNKFEGYEL